MIALFPRFKKHKVKIVLIATQKNCQYLDLNIDSFSCQSSNFYLCFLDDYAAHGVLLIMFYLADSFSKIAEHCKNLPMGRYCQKVLGITGQSI